MDWISKINFLFLLVPTLPQGTGSTCFSVLLLSGLSLEPQFTSHSLLSSLGLRLEKDEQDLNKHDPNFIFYSLQF